MNKSDRETAGARQTRQSIRKMTKQNTNITRHTKNKHAKFMNMKIVPAMGP